VRVPVQAQISRPFRTRRARLDVSYVQPGFETSSDGANATYAFHSADRPRPRYIKCDNIDFFIVDDKPQICD